ncbi:MAG TPA: hypothetical protein VHS99_01590, partial [Chloroflexota bacterium]|nr:hypothetical protein [Chloroflexota bacterium]
LILEQQAAEARAAAAALPLARATLERFQAARSQAQTLVDHQARLRLVTSEAEQIATRLREREQLSARSARLAGEVDRLRREHRATTAQINQLTPLVAERESIAVRLAALEGLQRRSSAVEEARRVLEDLEGQLAERVEVDFRHQEAQAALDAARRGLEALETQRRQVEAHRRLQARRAALQRWQAARAASEAATMARRLLDDLALAVSGVEHIAVRLQSESPAPGPRRKVKGDAGETAGLRLTLLLDHPLTGAQALSLRLWAGGAELVETRPATANEVSGLQAGKLPSLNTGDAGALAAELQLATAALEALGEGLPAGAADAGARLAEVEAALRQAPPPFDEEAYLQARTEVMSAERALREAAAAGATLPPAASIKRELARRRQALGAEVEACLAEASALRLRATDVDDLRDELAVIIPLQRERYDELGAVAGRRDAFQGQLAGLQRMGKELSRQLEECRQSLAADADDALQARLDALVAEQAQISAEATRLYAAVSAAVEHLPAAALAGARRDPGAVTVLAPAHRGYGGPTGETNGKLPADAPLDEGGERIAEPPVPPVQVPADGIPDVTALRQALQEQCDLAGGQVAVLEGQSAALPDVEARLEGAAASLATQREALVTALAEARGAMAAVGTRLDASAAPVAQTESPAATAMLAERQLAVLDVELRDLDEPAVRRQEQAAERELWSAEERLRRTQEEGQRLAEGLTALLAELGHPMPAPVAEEEPGPGAWATRLRAVCPEASPEDAGGLGSWEETELILANVQKREWDATQRIHSARLSLGDEPPMDLEAARQALAALELDLAARRRSQEIITHTRQRMIGKVLPDTMRNMCLLLPRLTAGRYRYAELTPDYRLQVWDERKRGYVEKNLYSGGTQDQFSLALRLGFALAALPRELGTSPGFLFLDEPLSSFDHDRTAALIDLLTHGQIATFFQQVFLISHSQAFDPGRFSHHIVMEEGCVQSSTLSPISE